MTRRDLVTLRTFEPADLGRWYARPEADLAWATEKAAFRIVRQYEAPVLDWCHLMILDLRDVHEPIGVVRKDQSWRRETTP